MESFDLGSTIKRLCTLLADNLNQISVCRSVIPIDLKRLADLIEEQNLLQDSILCALREYAAEDIASSLMLDQHIFDRHLTDLLYKNKITLKGT